MAVNENMCSYQDLDSPTYLQKGHPKHSLSSISNFSINSNIKPKKVQVSFHTSAGFEGDLNRHVGGFQLSGIDVRSIAYCLEVLVNCFGSRLADLLLEILPPNPLTASKTGEFRKFASLSVSSTQSIEIPH
jgi:hypothetical protein